MMEEGERSLDKVIKQEWANDFYYRKLYHKVPRVRRAILPPRLKAGGQRLRGVAYRLLTFKSEAEAAPLSVLLSRRSGGS